MLEYGVPQGLAVKVPYNDYIQQDRQQAEDLERAKSRAEARAKIQADDFDYKNAINSWDHAIIKDYATKKISEIGKWKAQNPGWQYNPQLYSEYKNMIKGITDNEHFYKGYRVDSEKNKFEAFLNDPKNADLRDLPEVQQYKQHLVNYLREGSIDGVRGNNIEFKFEPPSDYDFNPLLEQFGKKTPKALKSKSVLANGLLSLQYGATDNDIRNQSRSFLSNLNPYQSKKWAYNYKQKLAQSGLTPEKYSIEDYTKDTLEGHVTPDEFQHATYHVNDGNRSGGGGSGAKKIGTNNSLLSQVLKRSYETPGSGAQYTPGSAEELYIGKNGLLNTEGAKIFTKNSSGSIKNVTSLKGVSTNNWDFSNTKVTSFPIFNPETRKVEGYSSFVSGKVLLTPDEFNQMVGDENAVYDPWGFGETALQKKYDGDAKIVKKVNKDGKTADLIETTIHLPLQANNPQVHYASDHGAGTKSVEYGEGGNEDRYRISPDGTMYQDTETGIIYDRRTNKPIQQ